MKLLLIALIIFAIIVFVLNRIISAKIFPINFLNTHKLDTDIFKSVSSKKYPHYIESLNEEWKSIVIVLHGNATSAELQAERLKALPSQGYKVLIPEFQGYSSSDRHSPSKSRIRADLITFILDQRSQYPDTLIYLFGHSLGGAFAIEIASECDCDGLFTFGAFTRSSDFAPFLPKFLFGKNNLEPINRVHSIDIPWVIAHGSQDLVVPNTMHKNLVKTATDHNKNIYIPKTKTVGHYPEVADIIDGLKWLEKNPK